MGNREHSWNPIAIKVHTENRSETPLGVRTFCVLYVAGTDQTREGRGSRLASTENHNITVHKSFPPRAPPRSWSRT